MKFAASTLRSKVARRMFFVFLVASLFPFTALVTVSYYQVGSFFDQKNHQQLRDLAKLYGLDVHERLQLLHASLSVIASSVLLTGQLLDEDGLEKLPGLHKDRWHALSVYASDGSRHNILRELNVSLPNPTPEDRNHRASGKAALSILPRSGNGPPRLLMSVRIDPDNAQAGILVGEIKETYLWGIGETRLMPAHVEACVQTPGGILLQCSSALLAALPRALLEEAQETAIGDLAWEQDGLNFIASYWTVPMEYEFETQGWKILLRTTREGAFASIADLSNTFLLGILASAGLSILLAIAQIRKRLVPVENLKKGTQRIARQEFDHRIGIESDDEFGELATAVNSMASQLGRQFRMLANKSEIDRAVLSLLNTEKIVETILTRLTEVFPCQVACLTLVDGEESQKTFVLHQGQVRSKNDRGTELLIRKMVGARSAMNFNEDEIRELALDRGPESAARSILATPLIVQNDVLAVLAFYANEPQQFGDKELQLLNELNSQAAIAIFNAQLFERTKRQVLELEKANKAKDDFLAVVSHELRTPLNVMLGYLNILQENLFGELNSEQSEAVQKVETHATELLDLVNRILIAALLEAERVVIEKRPVPLAELFNRLKTQYSATLEKPIVLVWHYPLDLPTLYSDEDKLSSILQNIIDNAIKFTLEGEISISARANPDNHSVEFSVADTGIGIREEERAGIFELFRQVDNTGTRQFEGLGLGLFIARKLAWLMGGEILLQSEIGRGSTFTLRLPFEHNDDGRLTDSVLFRSTGPLRELPQGEAPAVTLAQK